jgi:hypothetical protein
LTKRTWIHLWQETIALVATPVTAGEAEVAGDTRDVGIKATVVVIKVATVGVNVAEVMAEAAASRGLNQSLLGGIRDTSLHACPTGNGIKCEKSVKDAKLALLAPTKV